MQEGAPRREHTHIGCVLMAGIWPLLRVVDVDPTEAAEVRRGGGNGGGGGGGEEGAPNRVHTHVGCGPRVGSLAYRFLF